MHLDLDLKLKENIFDVHSNSSAVDFKISFTSEDQVEPNPLEAFLSSLASCIGIFAYKYLKGAKIEFNRLDINIQSDLTKDNPMKLGNITLSIDTDGDLSNREEAFLNFLHKCPIHNTILNTDRVELKLKER